MLTHRPQPRLTGGEERPATPCLDHWWLYDVLIDTRGGPIFDEALTACRELCSTCPIWRECLAENRREQWAAAIITGRSTDRRRVA